MRGETEEGKVFRGACQCPIAYVCGCHCHMSARQESGEDTGSCADVRSIRRGMRQDRSGNEFKVFPTNLCVCVCVCMKKTL